MYKRYDRTATKNNYIEDIFTNRRRLLQKRLKIKYNGILELSRVISFVTSKHSQT